MEITPTNPVISVIIPIYNVEIYLSQCLDSVLQQTYKNLEIILVNDGSTDGSAQICEKYAAGDSRITLIHKENGGLSDARNAGLKIATGTYISFVDSDDLLALHFYDKMLNQLLTHNADIVECNFFKFESERDVKTVALTGSTVPESYTTESALISLMNEHLKQVVWNKVYKAQVIDQLEFPVSKINEDEFWTYRVFGNAQKVVKIDDVLYFYRQQSESIMGSKYSLRRLDGLNGLEERVEYMKKHFPALVDLAEKKFCFGSMFHYHQLSINKQVDPQKKYRKNILKKLMRYNRIGILKKWHWKEIVWYQLFIWSPKGHQLLSDYIDASVQNRKKREENV